MWKDLSMQQRADLMDIYLSHGVTSLDEMRKHYDSSRKHVYDGTTEDSQQMNRPNIYRYNDGRYVYQAAPDAEEIEVSPINTLLPNPSQWTYQDAEGKVYTPHAAQVDTGSITQDEDTNPLLRAANNYMREAAYRAKDGTLALQGKYTMPAIAASALLPLLGKAAASTSIAGIPATTWASTAATAGFAGHGLNHWLNEGINGWGDAAMTALELAPLGRLAKPLYKEAATAIENYKYPLGRLTVPKNYTNVTPKIRTRVGDVEIDNPNLLYHLDRGDGAGAFSNRGAYIEDGFLFPGTPKEASDIPYSWWNEGKPYSTSINGQPMTRLMTATKNAPGMIHVRSQNYPIGQWNGKRGLVLNTEYVNPEGVNVSGNTYILEPNYGWKKTPSEVLTIEWANATKPPQITSENAASITPEQWTAAQDAAIARGDVAEAQRLRDLHFKAKAPEADVPDQFHGTHYEDLGNQILLNKGVEQGTNGVGFYTSSNKPYARKYGPNIFKFKVNAKTEDLAQGRFAYLSENKMNELKAQGYKGTIDDTSGPMLGAGRDAVEYTFFDPNIYKSANAVTYDDNGVRIPLGLRDNFSKNDIRYGLLPFGIGLTGYGLWNNKEQE